MTSDLALFLLACCFVVVVFGVGFFFASLLGLLDHVRGQRQREGAFLVSHVVSRP